MKRQVKLFSIALKIDL